MKNDSFRNLVEFSIKQETNKQENKKTKEVKNKEYPKTLYVKQVFAGGGFNKEWPTKFFTEIVKNRKAEETFRAQAAGMEPNFTNEIQEVPFK